MKGKPHIRLRAKAKSSVVRLVPQACHPEVVAYLHDLHREAEQGDVRGVLAVIMYMGGLVGHGWSLPRYAPYIRLAGETEAAKLHLLMRHDPDLRGAMEVTPR